jgi:hypothetical protein
MFRGSEGKRQELTWLGVPRDKYTTSEHASEMDFLSHAKPYFRRQPPESPPLSPRQCVMEATPTVVATTGLR